MRLVIATPVDGDATTGLVAAGYASAVANLMRGNTIGTVPTQLTYSYDICRARNRVAAVVLAQIPEATHVLWWDSDVVPHDLRAIRSMLAANVDVIATTYPRKRYPIAAAHHPLPISRVHDDVEEVAAVPFGFTLTTTTCLRAMSTEYDAELGYTDVREGRAADRTVGIFNLAFRWLPDGNRELLSEDYSFCLRWAAMGGKIYRYVGPYAGMSHVGNHAYSIEVKR